MEHLGAERINMERIGTEDIGTEDIDEEQLLMQRLRCLKQRTGLSLAALASVTPFSNSTWHRYLSGDQFPPRSAVESLGRLADTDPGPLLSLWDAASRAQSRAATRPWGPRSHRPRFRTRPFGAGASGGPTGPSSPSRRWRPRWWSPRAQPTSSTPTCRGPRRRLLPGPRLPGAVPDLRGLRP